MACSEGSSITLWHSATKNQPGAAQIWARTLSFHENSQNLWTWMQTAPGGWHQGQPQGHEMVAQRVWSPNGIGQRLWLAFFKKILFI